MLLLLLVLRDPVLIISYLIYYIICVVVGCCGVKYIIIVGYDVGGYIVVGGVAGVGIIGVI